MINYAGALASIRSKLVLARAKAKRLTFFVLTYRLQVHCVLVSFEIVILILVVIHCALPILLWQFWILLTCILT